MKKRILILGAGGLGREIETWLSLVPEQERDWYFGGFLDVRQDILRGKFSKLKVIGNEDNFIFRENDYVILAVSDTQLRCNIYEKIKDKVQFFTFISPLSIIGDNVHLSEGVFVCPGAIISSNVKLGKNVFVNYNSCIAHDCIVDALSILLVNVSVSGNCKIGKNVLIGSGSTIIQGTNIYDNATVGIGSVVIGDVNEKTTVFGNPAREIK